METIDIAVVGHLVIKGVISLGVFGIAIYALFLSFPLMKDGVWFGKSLTTIEAEGGIKAEGGGFGIKWSSTSIGGVYVSVAILAIISVSWWSPTIDIDSKTGRVILAERTRDGTVLATTISERGEIVVTKSYVQNGDGPMTFVTGVPYGGFLGTEIATFFDKSDKLYAEQVAQEVLEEGPIGWAWTWINTDNNKHWGTVKPIRDYQIPLGWKCRDYQASVHIGDRTENTRGTACREPSGVWSQVYRPGRKAGPPELGAG